MARSGRGTTSQDTLATKLDALFRTRRRAGGEYTYEEVASGIAARGGPTVSASYLYLLRKGVRDNPTKRHLEALADFFGIPVSHFFDEPANPTTARGPRTDPELLTALGDPRVVDLVRAALDVPPETLAAATHLVTRAGRSPRTEMTTTTTSSVAGTARSNLARARSALRNGDIAAARHQAESVLARPDLPADVRDEALDTMGTILERAGDTEAAAEIYRDLLNRCIDGTCALPLTPITLSLATVLVGLRRTDEAVEVVARGVDTCRTRPPDNVDDFFRLLATLVDLEMRAGRLDSAEVSAGELLAETERSASAWGQAASLRSIGTGEYLRGNYPAALASLRTALAVLTERSDGLDLARVQSRIAELLLRVEPDRLTEATDLLNTSRHRLDLVGSTTDRAIWFSIRSLAHLVAGDPQRAEASAREAVAVLGATVEVDRITSLLWLGDAVRAQGRTDEAREHYRAAVDALRERPRNDQLIGLWRDVDARLGHQPDNPLDREQESDPGQDVTFAQVALTNGEPATARDRLRALLDGGGLDTAVRHEAMRLLGEALFRLGDTDSAIHVHQTLFDECVASETKQSLPKLTYSLIFLHISHGDVAEAIRIGELGVRASRAAGLDSTDDYRTMWATLLSAYHLDGEEGLAWSLAGQVVAEARESGSPVGEEAARLNAAVLAESQGKLTLALQLAEEAMALSAENGDEFNVVRLQLVVAWYRLAATPHRHDEAAALLDRCRPQLAAIGTRTDMATWEALTAMAHLLAGRRREAVLLARRAVLHLKDTTQHEDLARALLILGDVEIASGQEKQALSTYRSVLSVPTEQTSRGIVAMRYREVAERLALLGEPDEALAVLRDALDHLEVRWAGHAFGVALATETDPTSQTTLSRREQAQEPDQHP